MKEKNKEDIGMIDEILELCKNLCSMEAHAQASFKITKDKRFLSAKNDIREIRKEYLGLITKRNFGQIWCFNKHSCESLMRLDEIQARFLSTSQEKEAISCSEQSDIILEYLIDLNDLDKGEVKSSA